MEKGQESMSMVDLIMMGYSGDKVQDTRKVVQCAVDGKVSTGLNKPELFTLASLLVKFICPLQEPSANQIPVQANNAPDVAKSFTAQKGALTQFEEEELNGAASEQNTSSANIVTRTSQKKTETPVICFHYRRNNCKYFGKQQGKCKFSHPKKCNTYMTHGPKSHKNPKGCDQKQCSSYHPKLCHQSVKNKLCPREKCNYSHLRGTKRNSQRNEWKSAQDLKTPHEGNNGLSGLQTSVSNPPWSQAVT